MKLKRVLFALIVIAATKSFAQSDKDVKDAKYRRSSLHTILIESESFPKKDQVIGAYYNAPFPDKFDNHTIGEKSFDPKKYGLVKESSDENNISAINEYFTQKKIANKLVAKWFNRKENGTFDINLVSHRGLINASFTDIKTAEASSEGKALLQSAGLELIGNTFVVVSKMKFIENEPIARVTRDAAIIAANKLSVSLLRNKAIDVADKAYERGKEGYSVWTTSYLYKLRWDDATSNTFYQDYWIDDSSAGNIAEKKSKFDNSDLFQLDFIGSESSTSLVTFSLNGKRTENEIINLAVTRNVDKVYAKLQKKYDVFKTKVPLFTGNPITAKIGIKEGLEAGDKFEVLEANMDPKTGIIEYKRKGTIKVVKDRIWDNRYTGGLPLLDDDGNEINSPLEATTFEGGGKYYPGMLIRQIN